jgi:hypothetical protein
VNLVWFVVKKKGRKVAFRLPYGFNDALPAERHGKRITPPGKGLRPLPGELLY